MKMVQIAPGSRNWYNPMHVIEIEEMVNYLDGARYVRVTLGNGQVKTTYDDIDEVRARVDEGLKG